jgi:hypothetical protein
MQYSLCNRLNPAGVCMDGRNSRGQEYPRYKSAGFLFPMGKKALQNKKYRLHFAACTLLFENITASGCSL